MGNFRAEIDFVKHDNTTETVSYGIAQIKDLNTRSFCTNDPTRPVFDVFPNTGLLVIKDLNLDLYNRALDGYFDNTYKFNVRFYKGQNLIASHIINQRPSYDFNNKTLTLNLGNDLDNLDNVIYKGYDYPLEKKPLSNLTEDIFKNIFGEDYKFSKVSYENEKSFHKNISVLYTPESSSKETLKKICEAQGSSLIQEAGTKNFLFLDMLGKSGENSPIYKILPKHTKGSFSPNIILDNRFSNAIVNSTKIYSSLNNNVLISQKHIDSFNIDSLLKKTHNYSFSSEAVTTIPNEYEPEAGEHYVDFLGVKTLNSFYFNFQDEFYKLFNHNLSEIKSFSLARTYNTEEISSETNEPFLDGENNNPTISLVLEKRTYNPIARDGVASSNKTEFKVSNWDIDNTDISTLRNGIPDKEILNETIVDYVLPFDFSKTFSTGKTINFKIDLYTDKFYEKPFKNEEGDKYFVSSKVLVGYSYLKCYAEKQKLFEQSDEQFFGSTVQLVEIVPISATYSYNGVVEEIKFDENLQINSTKDNTNTIETQQGNELIQTNLDGSIENSSAKLLQEDLYNFYKNGIRTADLEVVFGNYEATNGNKKNIDEPFTVGDFVIPCKDNQGNPFIINKYFEKHIYKANSAYLDGDLYYDEIYLQLPYKILSVEIKHSDNVKKIELLGANGTAITQSGNAIYLKFYTKEQFEDVEFEFKVGVKNLPVVYKVVDVEIDYNGGAGSQRLKLMEFPNISLEETANISEPMATMLLDEETPLETTNEESQNNLSKENETSQEMSNNAFDDLINL